LLFEAWGGGVHCKKKSGYGLAVQEVHPPMTMT
jgi:hypothetical protein